MRQEATVRLHTSQVINANDRTHWRKHAEMKAVLVQFGALALGRGMKPERSKARVTFEFTFPTKRRRDRANLHPTVKSLLDGIVKAGVLADDSDLFVEGPDIVIREDGPRVPGFVLVKVTVQDVRGARLNEAEAQIMRDRDAVQRERDVKAAERAAARRVSAK